MEELEVHLRRNNRTKPMMGKPGVKAEELVAGLVKE